MFNTGFLSGDMLTATVLLTTPLYETIASYLPTANGGTITLASLPKTVAL